MDYNSLKIIHPWIQDSPQRRKNPNLKWESSPL